MTIVGETKRIQINPSSASKEAIEFDACSNPEAGAATSHDLLTALWDYFPGGCVIDLEKGTITAL